MEETESLVEYREYLQYQKLYDELLAAIAANGQTDEELTKQLYALAAVIVPQLVQKRMLPVKNCRMQKHSTGRVRKKRHRQRQIIRNYWAGLRRQNRLQCILPKRLNRQKRTGCLYGKAGILVMEKAGEEYSACTQKIKEQEEQLLQTEGQLSQVEALLSKSRQQQASCRARIELLTEQLGQAETKKNRNRKKSSSFYS